MIARTAVGTRRGRRWARIRDFLLYCAIAVSLVVLIILYGNHQIHAKEAPGFPVKWLGFSIMTGLVFLNAFRSHRDHWGQHRFWVLMTLFSIFHFSAGAVVVSRLGKVGLIDFALATLVEYFALSAYLDHFMVRKE
jgi:hypothetical protein